jgi:hypothetical protein
MQDKTRFRQDSPQRKRINPLIQNKTPPIRDGIFIILHHFSSCRLENSPGFNGLGLREPSPSRATQETGRRQRKRDNEMVFLGRKVKAARPKDRFRARTGHIARGREEAAFDPLRSSE